MADANRIQFLIDKIKSLIASLETVEITDADVLLDRFALAAKTAGANVDALRNAVAWMTEQLRELRAVTQEGVIGSTAEKKDQSRLTQSIRMLQDIRSEIDAVEQSAKRAQTEINKIADPTEAEAIRKPRRGPRLQTPTRRGDFEPIDIGAGPQFAGGRVVTPEDVQLASQLTDQRRQSVLYTEREQAIMDKMSKLARDHAKEEKWKADYAQQRNTALEDILRKTRDYNLGLDKQAGLGEFIVGKDNKYLSSVGVEEKAAKALESYGFALKDIVSVEKDRRTGTVEISAATTDFADRTERATISIDRLGNVTGKSTSAFRTMADNIAQSISQFAKFMVSATLVYGILNQVQEQIGVVIQNEAELANIAIVLGDSQSKLNAVFESAAQAANLTSTSINGVLEGYQQAIRATGNVANEYERISDANAYMTESLVLSRLSTLDQAKAMDILVAGLKQSGIEIENSRDMLDRWVATTKIANVDMRTLAESYAIVATVAQSAGIEVKETNNELVGLIAVLAEQTQLTPTETGNALRAAITGLNTDSAIRELRKFGISVTDTNGDIRDFLDVIGQLNQLYKSEIIDEASLTKIARAIGGGTRRQAQVEILIKNLDRAMDINKETSGQYGAAQEALAIQTDTLQDAITRLSNAFQELAQTWGTEGGLLDLATDVVEAFTDVLKLANSISGAVGGALPGILAVGGASIFARSKNRFLGEGIANRIDDFTTRPGSNLPTMAGGYSYGRWGAGIAGGALGSVLPAVTNFMQGENAEGTANIVGGVIGGAIGGVLGGPTGIAVGSTIGSAISEAFVGAVTSDVDDIGQKIYDRWKEAQERDTKSGVGGAGDETKPISGSDLFTELGGNEYFGGIMAQLYKLGSQEFRQFGDIYTEKTLTGRVTRGSELFGGALEKAQGQEDWDKEDFALYLLERYRPEKFQEWQERVLPEQAAAGEAIPNSEFLALGDQIVTSNRDLIDSIQQEFSQDFLKSISAGETSGRQLTYQKDVVDGLTTSLTNILPAILSGAGTLDIGDDLLSTADAIDYVATAFVGATEEEQGAINDLVSEIYVLANQIQVEKDLKVQDADKIKELTNLKDTYSQALQELIVVTKKRVEASKYETPGLVNVGAKLTQQGIQNLISGLPEAQRAYQDAMYTSIEAQEAYIESLKSIILDLGGFEYVNLSDIVEGAFDPKVVSDFLSELKDQVGNFMEESGQIQNPGFIDLPFNPGSGEASQFWAAYQQLLSQLQILGYQEDTSETIAVYGNKQLELMSKDNTIIQMLLGSIEENTSDMVDGVYNLPTDGTFFVPWTGAKTAQEPGGGFGGIPNYEAIASALLKAQEEAAALAAAQQQPVSRHPDFMETTYDPERAEFFKPQDERRRMRAHAASHPLDETDLQATGAITKTGEPLTTDSMRAIMDNFSATISSSLLNTPINITVDISASFETFIDGELVGQVSKQFLTEEMVRLGNTQGTQVSAVI